MDAVFECSIIGFNTTLLDSFWWLCCVVFLNSFCSFGGVSVRLMGIVTGELVRCWLFGLAGLTGVVGLAGLEWFTLAIGSNVFDIVDREDRGETAMLYSVGFLIMGTKDRRFSGSIWPTLSSALPILLVTVLSFWTGTELFMLCALSCLKTFISLLATNVFGRLSWASPYSGLFRTVFCYF